MNTTRHHVIKPTPERTASTAATIAAAGALLCGVCCVLPFALPAVAIASAGGILAFFADWFWGALYAAVAMVASAWVWVIRTSLRTRKRPAHRTLVMMTFATIILAIAAVWPTVEPHIIEILKPRT